MEGQCIQKKSLWCEVAVKAEDQTKLDHLEDEVYESFNFVLAV